jgi:NTE family protein
MDAQVQSRMTTGTNHLPFEVVALVLQGGGALGAYQAGVYEALSEAGIHPNWIAGMSIGAINAAIIAGNPPDSRVERLRILDASDRPWTVVWSGLHGLGPWRCHAPVAQSNERGVGRWRWRFMPSIGILLKH